MSCAMVVDKKIKTGRLYGQKAERRTIGGTSTDPFSIGEKLKTRYFENRLAHRALAPDSLPPGVPSKVSCDMGVEIATGMYRDVVRRSFLTLSQAVHLAYGLRPSCDRVPQQGDIGRALSWKLPGSSMSGLEALAIPALVGTLISAFTGATNLYRTWRKDRKERREKAENEEFHSLVSTSGGRVQHEYDIDFGRMGRRFAEGDEVSYRVLSQHIMTLQSTVIKMLSPDSSYKAASFILRPNHSQLTSFTTAARDGSVTALEQLYQRISQASSIRRIVVGTATGRSSARTVRGRQ
ncbi:hypothetical protein LTR95_004737 [Oleoguttula sp. CCFEE 5521]